MTIETTEFDSSGLTIPERVAEFLKNNSPRAFCDDCLAGQLKVRREQVNTVTSTLGLCCEYSRGGETCTICNRERKFAIHYLGEKILTLGAGR